MIVMIVLGATLLLARLVGAAGVEALNSWPAATWFRPRFRGPWR